MSENWIDVYKELPKESDSYLVIEIIIFPDRKIKQVVRFCYFDAKKGRFDRTPAGERCITHWMKIPQKPPLKWRQEYNFNPI